MGRVWTLAGLLAIAMFSGNAFSADEVSQTFTLDGKLWADSLSTNPLLDNHVFIKVQILSNDSTCILYEEIQSVSTLNTEGKFAIQVGSPALGLAAAKRG